MKVYVGAENIISPLGNTAEECFNNVINNRSGVKENRIDGQKYALARINKEEYSFTGSFWQHLLKSSITDSLKMVNESGEITYIVSSAKGEIDNINKPIEKFGLSHSVKAVLGDESEYLCVSNACISGLLAINLAYDLIKAEKTNTVVVAGIDLISDFVIAGFRSLYALDDERCKPFDQRRKGLNLGEGVGTCVLSSDESIFKETPIEFLGGFSNNDANHISGPSRTGEGLKKAVNRALSSSGITPDFISAHGTGTNYNDGMEAEAFYGLELNSIPINSLKPYFGHTLGAAGTIETIISMQGLRNNMIPGTLGFKHAGTDKEINVQEGFRNVETSSFLKTCSGFGGGNAAGMFRKL